MKRVKNTLDNIMAARPVPTIAMLRGLCLDKGHDFDEVRDIAKAFSFTAHIRARGKKPKLSNERRALKHAVG